SAAPGSAAGSTASSRSGFDDASFSSPAVVGRGIGSSSDAPLLESKTSAHRVAGSMSTSSAFVIKDSGIANTAPSGPITQVQKTSDRNVSVTDNPTASPTNFGWITDWITTLTVE